MADPDARQVESWLRRRTVTGPPPALDDLIARKIAGDSTVTVCLPALDEASTIGPICSAIRRDLQAKGLVDELIVMDSGSVDETAAIATGAGAEVHSTASVMQEVGIEPLGKGDALWKSLAVATGDIIVWLDADIRDFETGFVPRLLAPLLRDPSLVMTKAFYERPLAGSDDPTGGRVTEVGARPLLRLLYPRLSGVVQPLSGEYALRREAAWKVPFLTGYGVDAALLIDVVEEFGLDALAQVDLGKRVHRNRDLLSLGRTSFQVMRAMLLRLQARGRIDLAAPLPEDLLQFQGNDARPRSGGSGVQVRPPMQTVLRSPRAGSAR